MYYYASPSGVARSGIPTAGLPLTPTVALRSLYEQLHAFEVFTARGNRIDVYAHFAGAIVPPTRGVRRPMGDPVFDAVADYASKVIARAGLLTSKAGNGERNRLDEYSRMSRQVFTAEHALAVDLARTVPDVPLREREVNARAVLALAAFWCDRDKLVSLEKASAHRLLGEKPSDAIGAVLFQHAADALSPRQSGGPNKKAEEQVIELSREINLAPAS